MIYLLEGVFDVDKARHLTVSVRYTASAVHCTVGAGIWHYRVPSVHLLIVMFDGIWRDMERKS
jgi:hypothetical protein